MTTAKVDGPSAELVERPWQPWERNFSGGRLGVQEQQGANENWMILHVESGGVKTTTSLRHHEAWDLALMISPQLKAEMERRHAENRQMHDALYQFRYAGTQADVLRKAADEITCGENCAYHWDGRVRCPKAERDGCPYEDANELRELAEAIDTQVRVSEAGPSLLEALKGVMDILGRAESNASGNPEFDYVGPRVAAARAALTRALAQEGK